MIQGKATWATTITGRLANTQSGGQNHSSDRCPPLAPSLAAASSAPAAAPTGLLTDTHGRLLRDLRISVTDRYNFHCAYCMPKNVFGHDYPLLPHAERLTFEEITRPARVFEARGIEKIRLTEGEPLDALDDDVSRAMNDVDFPIARVLEGIDGAAAAGFTPIKINVAVKRDLNEQKILPMARRFKDSGHILRFIEYMDVGHTND